MTILWSLIFFNIALADGDSSFKWYTVKEVLSGESVRIMSGKEIRYASIEAPDISHINAQVRDMAVKSKDFNRSLVDGKKIRLEWGSKIRSSDGAYVAFVFMENGVFVNDRVLLEGYAKAAIEQPNVEYADELRKSAKRARNTRRGLWALERPDAAGRTKGVIGDKMKREFHLPDCEELEGVPGGHRAEFDSPVDAISKGYKMAKCCKGKRYRQRTDLY